MALTEFERIIQGKKSSGSSPSTPKVSDSGKITDLRDESFKSTPDEYGFPEDSGIRQLDDQTRGTALNDRDSSDIKNHDHNGENSQRIALDSLTGLIGTISTVPTFKPTKISDQIVIYVSGGTKRLYIYDTSTKAWMYTTLT